MGRFIVHHDGAFLEWSTVVDAPVTVGMTEAELREHVAEQYGLEGLKMIDGRIARAVANGTSCICPPYDFDDIVSCNRAGPDETELTREQLIRIYFVERREPDRARLEDWGKRPDE